MNWKGCRRLMNIILFGTAFVTRWKAITRPAPGSTIRSHSRMNSGQLRMPSFRKRIVCAFYWKKLPHRLPWIQNFNMTILHLILIGRSRLHPIIF